MIAAVIHQKNHTEYNFKNTVMEKAYQNVSLFFSFI